MDKDDEREVPERIGKSFANEHGFDYFLETSALDSTNVENLFQEVAQRLTEAMEFNDERFHTYSHNQNQSISLVDRVQEQANNCCRR
uniref:Uncharacterized protein n=1 Tax=Panagrolaimus sp. PS1159 TaxID=55785 RepID=A0AC35GNB1_9BILA